MSRGIHPVGVDWKKQQFASDNYSGMCPEAMQALLEVNQNHEPSYGDDRWTHEVCEGFRNFFEKDCEVFFVFNGTAANSLSLAHLCRSYHSIICQNYAHLETDECGAPEFFSHGSKVLQCDGPDGKLEPRGIVELIEKRSDIHYPKPQVVSVTQSTECGTVYEQEELLAISSVAKNYGLKVHMDGARFFNALATLKCAPSKITHEAGVDVLCLGGSKNGLGLGDAVIFFNSEDAHEFAYRCKQAGQLASKMRFISAQWLGLLKDEAWKKHATHANESAAYLEKELAKLKKIDFLFPRQSNAVFIKMPESVMKDMHLKGWKFYSFIGAGGARLMCSWDTKRETIESFIADLKVLL